MALYPCTAAARTPGGYTGTMRDTLIIIGLALVAVVAGSFIFLYGRGSLSNTSSSAVPYGAPVAAAATVPFTELAQGAHSTVSARANYRITSQTQLAELWKMIDARGQTPVIDFAANDVIAVFAGKEPTAGYAIAVSKVEDANTREVTVALTSPGGSCVLAQSVTAPYQVIELPKTSLALTHVDQAITASCPR